jgi:hypothetical protein
MKRTRLCLVASLAVGALMCVPFSALAQVAPPLGTAQQFGVLGNSATTGATGSGVVVTGDVGSSPTPTVSNFPPSTTVAPFIVHYANDAVVQQARIDSVAAYNALLAQGAGTVLPDNLATVGALGPGIYSFVTGAPDLPASSTLTLNGSGIFIFNVGSSLTANVFSNVVGTANPCNIYWRVGSDATLNGANFRGTVLASASITVGAGANLAGRALAGNGATGAVTMAGSGGNTIGGCASPAVVPPASCPVITVAPSTLPAATAGVAYTHTLVASGGTGPYNFAVTAGAVPAGLTLSAAGVLSGTPTTAGNPAFTIRATDTVACFGDLPVTLAIAAAVPTLPEMFLIVLALGLAAVGYLRLRRRDQTG